MRQQGDRSADTHFFGALRDRSRDDLRRGTDVAAKVMLAEPDRIEAQFFGVINFLEEVFVVLLFGTIFGVMIEESQKPKLHRRASICYDRFCRLLSHAFLFF
jgi:hypothetical protein